MSWLCWRIGLWWHCLTKMHRQYRIENFVGCWDCEIKPKIQHLEDMGRRIERIKDAILKSSWDRHIEPKELSR